MRNRAGVPIFLAILALACLLFFRNTAREGAQVGGGSEPQPLDRGSDALSIGSSEANRNLTEGLPRDSGNWFIASGGQYTIVHRNTNAQNYLVNNYGNSIVKVLRTGTDGKVNGTFVVPPGDNSGEIGVMLGETLIVVDVIENANDLDGARGTFKRASP